ncbi:MAG: hypothetical protein FJ254_04650 [Phycisphaerae bacterium]|nr:hypothetical protein [Phycisphaerae bacterium]
MRWIPHAWHAWLDANPRAASAVCGAWWIALWAIIWFVASWLSSFWTNRIELALPFERTAAPMHWMIPIYASYDLIAPMLPLFCRGWRDYAELGRTILLQTAISCAIYIVLPQRLAFSTTHTGAVWDWLSGLTGLPHPGLYSYAPSMHVAGVIAIGMFFAPRLGRVGVVTLWTWCAAVIASTWMVQEHHLADIASGIALALVIRPRSVDSAATRPAMSP